MDCHNDYRLIVRKAIYSPVVELSAGQVDNLETGVYTSGSARQVPPHDNSWRELNTMSNAVNRYFEGLLVGGALGFIVGLLTAPKAGSELRQELADNAEDLLNQVNDQLGDVRGLVSDRVQPLADRASVLKDRVADRAADLRVKAAGLRDRAVDMKERAITKAGVLKERALDKAQELGARAEQLSDAALEKAQHLKSETFDASGGGKGQELLNNYMGNNSGPMYTRGNND